MSTVLLDTLPRYSLANLPTPLETAPRLSHEVGLRVLIKRDDLTGFALGGNKVRKLEFLLADALGQGADTLITGGGPQSNHARLTAAAARKAGMEALLIFWGNPPAEENGNLLLDRLLGAEIRYTGTNDRRAADLAITAAADELRAAGRKPYPIPVGGSTTLGCAAYILAVGELLAQLETLSVTPDYIFITTGSCGTHAGVLAGMKYYGAKIPVYGITVSRPLAECLERIPRLVDVTARFLNTPLTLNKDDVVVDDRFLGPAYGVITPEAREAIRLAARTEGLFLDPVYTGKAMAGLVSLAREGTIKPGATVVFWHTGGAPGLFGHAADFSDPPAPKSR
jgi:D-cysteine desulfhydrase family pyridoxal phosphate-dependent enzyme